jgi:DNA-binding MarR family transcriptional regulator
MEQLLELLLGGGVRLPFLSADLLALDRELPKSELLALLMLQRRGEANMSELAADLSLPLSTVTGIGARLAKRGLAERHRDERDRRVILVRLTPPGQQLAGRVRVLLDSLFDRIQAALAPEELQVLLALVQKVLAALQAEGGPGKPGETASPAPRAIPITVDEE